MISEVVITLWYLVRPLKALQLKSYFPFRICETNLLGGIFLLFCFLFFFSPTLVKQRVIKACVLKIGNTLFETIATNLKIPSLKYM